MRTCQTCVCEQQLGCLDLSGAEVRGPGAQEPSVCLGSLWEPCPTRSDPTEPKSEESEKSKLCSTNANAGGVTRTPDTRIMIPPVSEFGEIRDCDPPPVKTCFAVGAVLRVCEVFRFLLEHQSLGVTLVLLL